MLCAELERLEAQLTEIIVALENPDLTDQQRTELEKTYAQMSHVIGDHQKFGHEGAPCFEEYESKPEVPTLRTGHPHPSTTVSGVKGTPPAQLVRGTADGHAPNANEFDFSFFERSHFVGLSKTLQNCLKHSVLFVAPTATIPRFETL